MSNGWWKENWEDIKYAHKSVWLSMAVFLLIACYGTWYVAGYIHAREMAEKDVAIGQLNAQLLKIHKETEKKKHPPKVSGERLENSKLPEGPYNDSNIVIDSLGEAKEKVSDTLYNEGYIK